MTMDGRVDATLSVNVNACSTEKQESAADYDRAMTTAQIVAAATAIVLTLCGVIAKMYRDRTTEQRSHKRDLRRVAGLPTHSDEPPPTVPTRPPPRKPRQRR